MKLAVLLDTVHSLNSDRGPVPLIRGTRAVPSQLKLISVIRSEL